MSKSVQIPVSVRLIAFLLQHRFGKVQAMERALQLQGVVRFVLLTFFLIVLPSIILATLTLGSLRYQETSIRSELQETSDRVSRSFIDMVDVEFTGIESLVSYLLEAGKSPMSLLHQHQRIALRFDVNQQLIAPIIDSHQVDWRQDFHPARLSNQPYRSLSTEPAETTHHIDLIKSTESLPSPQRIQQLQNQLNSLLGTVWSLRDGLKVALSYRVLAQLNQEDLDNRMRVYIDASRIRVDERAQMLYWANAWEDEWRSLIQESKITQPGALHWQVKDNAIWARTNWANETYVFGLDKERMLTFLSEAAAKNSRNDRWVQTHLIAPTAVDPPDILTKRYLPWLEGWSVAVTQKNKTQLLIEQQRLKIQRVMMVIFSLVMMGIGAFLAARVVAREIELASIKSNFAANVSHELRSPITQIRLKGESLLYGLSVTEDEKEHDVAVIIRESERLTWLVENVLDYTAIERSMKQYYFHSSDISDTVYRAIESLQATLSMADAIIDFNIAKDMPPVRHDPHAIGQCVVNLVTNAIKYSGDEKWVRLRLMRQDECVVIVVSDKGIGIPAQDLPFIFDPFFRSDDRDARRQKGTGIGLSITKHIIEAHGGSIQVQSVIEMGSTFTLRLPHHAESEGEIT